MRRGPGGELGALPGRCNRSKGGLGDQRRASGPCGAEMSVRALGRSPAAWGRRRAWLWASGGGAIPSPLDRTTTRAAGPFPPCRGLVPFTAFAAAAPSLGSSRVSGDPLH